MTCESCQRERTITLTGGEQCCSWCEAWRHECEARWLMSLPSKSRRRDFLDGGVPLPNGRKTPGVLGMRGAAEVSRLEAKVVELWSTRNAGK